MIGGHLITQIGEAGGIIITLLVAALVGVVNGLGVVVLRLPPLVMTLASLSVIQGVLLVYNAGKPVSGESTSSITGLSARSLVCRRRSGSGRAFSSLSRRLLHDRLRQGDLRDRQ